MESNGLLECDIFSWTGDNCCIIVRQIRNATMATNPCQYVHSFYVADAFIRIINMKCIHYSGIFAGFGLSGVIPAIHYISVRGFIRAFTIDPFGWLLLMAVLYILGVLFYSSRIPERWYKGKCDIMVKKITRILFRNLNCALFRCRVRVIRYFIS